MDKRYLGFAGQSLELVGKALASVFPTFFSAEHGAVLQCCLNAINNGINEDACYSRLATICKANSKPVGLSHHLGKTNVGLVFCFSPGEGKVCDITISVLERNEGELISVLEVLQAVDRDMTVELNMVAMPVGAALDQFAVIA